MTLRHAHRLVLLAVALVAPASSVGAQGPFPLRPSENGRFLVDAGGQPFPILGRTAWFMALLSTADVAVFLDDTRARGFNAVELALIGHDRRGRHAPFDDRGAAPFLRRIDSQPWSGGLKYADAAAESPDFTTPNEAYWRGIDALLADLESRGLLAFVFPAYVGYAGNTNQGWMGEMVASGPDRMRTYGEFVARRYAGRNNLVWMLGGDFRGVRRGAGRRGARAGRRVAARRSSGRAEAALGRMELRDHRHRSARVRPAHHAERRLHVRRPHRRSDAPRLRGDAGAAGVPARGAVRRGGRRRHQRQPPRDAAGAPLPVVGMARIDWRLRRRQRLRVAVRRRGVAGAPRHGRLARSRPPQRPSAGSRGTRWSRPAWAGCAS